MHQIGNTFTRLQPAIEFAESALQRNCASGCILGDSPTAFATVHTPALINAWYDKLQSCLAEPVQTEQRRGHRRAQVLGTAIFDFGPDGQLRVFSWDFDKHDHIQLTELPPRSVVVQGVPFQAVWMQRFQLGAFRYLQRRHPGEASLCQSYLDWAQAELMARCWTDDVQQIVRYRIAVELELDTQAMDLSSRVQLSALPRLPLRADAYNHALLHRQNYATLGREAPQLIPLYTLLAEALHDFDPDCQHELTARMRAYLVNQGLGSAIWRTLCRDGTEWMKELQAYCNFTQQSPADAALDLLRIALAFGTAQLAPTWLLHAFVQLGANPNRPMIRISNRLDDLFELCARMGHLAVQADEDDLALLKDRCQSIFYWASSHLAHMSDGFVRRVTLRGLIRRVEQQQAREAKQLQSSEAWSLPYAITFDREDVQAVILDSPLAVWEEGRLMRHCADRYIDACARGELLMISLRSNGHSRPLATVAFDVRATTVTQRRISGFANSLVSPKVHQLAQQCAQQLQVQRKHSNHQVTAPTSRRSREPAGVDQHRQRDGTNGPSNNPGRQHNETQSL